MNEERTLRVDRMRFTKNKLSSTLAIIAIVFDVFYFVSIYKSDVGSWYYSILVGASIIYNLVFMLAVFLASEGVKNYKEGYSYLLMVIGVFQIVRIFILPMKAHSATVTIKDEVMAVMGNAQFSRVVLYLVISAVCCIASAVINIKKSRMLEAHTATLDGNKA